MKKPYSKKQIEILKNAYPIGDWDTIFKYFPNSNKAAIKGYANKHGIFKNTYDSLSNKDISNTKYNKLTAISFDRKVRNMVYWKCKCDCGNFTSVPIYSLVNGKIKSCGCIKHNQPKNSKDFTGIQFGMLTAIERLSRYRNDGTYYKCKCVCGNEAIVKSGNLRSGHTTSCGKHNHKTIDYWDLKHNSKNDDRTYYVYRHVAPNEKMYIGITKQNPEDRFRNGNGYSTQPAFWRAIKKYGWESFKHEIIEQGLTEEEACKKEIFYINEVYNSLAPNGYNTQKGGISGNTLTTPIIQYYRNEPVNFFESITVASKKLNVANATIRSHVGENNKIGDYYFEMLPKIHVYNIEQKYWDIRNEKHFDISGIVAVELRKTTIARNLMGSKSINKYDLNGNYICTYKSIAEAKRDTGLSKAEGISAAVNPNRQGNVAYGYMYRYDTGDHKNIEPIKYVHKQSVYQIDNNGLVLKEFSSISEASRKFHTSNNCISRACSKGEMWKGYYWKFKQ